MFLSRLRRVGYAFAAAGVIALLVLVGVPEAHWCPATGEVVSGGSVDTERPWELSDGSETALCEVEGIRYSWVECTQEACGGVNYASRVYYPGDGYGYAQ